MLRKLTGIALCVVALALFGAVTLQTTQAGVCDNVECAMCAETGTSCSAGASSVYSTCEVIQTQFECESVNAFSIVCGGNTSATASFCCPGVNPCNGTETVCGEKIMVACVWSGGECTTGDPEGGTVLEEDCTICVCT